MIKNSHTISRRTLLQAGGLAGLAALIPSLAGCGGSDNPNDSLPEGYSEAYVRDLTDEQGIYPGDARVVSVSPTGDLVLAQFTSQDYPSYAFQLVQFKDRARPGAARTVLTTPKILAERADNAVTISSGEQIYLSRFLVDDVPPVETDNEFVILDPNGAKQGTVTLVGGSSTGFGNPLYTTLAVSPIGEFYCGAQVPTPEGFVTGEGILRWDATGTFVKVYSGTENRRFNGFLTAFAPDGTLLTLGYDANFASLAVVRVEDNPQATEVLIRTKGAVGSQLETDAAGNFYFISSEPGTRAAPTRLDPPPPAAYLRKFSPTGVELAAVQIGNFYSASPITVDGAGNVYLIVGGELHVFQRSR